MNTQKSMLLPLKKGDKVAIIAPASFIPKKDFHLINKAIEILQNWGLDISYITDFNRSYGAYLAGTDDERTNELINVLLDNDIKAIFCARGGYGCARILDKLNQIKIDKLCSKYLIGFSDICSLHIFFANSPINCIHGPTVVSNNFIGDNESAINNRQKLHELLFSETNALDEFSNKSSVKLISPEQNNYKEIKGNLSGGCLSMLQTSIGTSEFSNLQNKILLIEEVTEPIYRIDRTLVHLKNTGLFDTTKAIVLGDFYQCPPESNSINHSEMSEIYSLFTETLYSYSFPILAGLPFGHDKNNLCWRYNQHAMIDCVNELFYW